MATVCRLKHRYEDELRKHNENARKTPRDTTCGKENDDPRAELLELLSKKMGRPLLLGANLDRQVRAYLNTIRECGGAVNTYITDHCNRYRNCNEG